MDYQCPQSGKNQVSSAFCASSIAEHEQASTRRCDQVQPAKQNKLPLLAARYCHLSDNIGPRRFRATVAIGVVASWIVLSILEG